MTGNFLRGNLIIKEMNPQRLCHCERLLYNRGKKTHHTFKGDWFEVLALIQMFTVCLVQEQLFWHYNRWGFEEVNFVISHQKGNIIPFKKKTCPNLQGTSVYFYLPFKDHILFWKNALKKQKPEVTWNIHFYEMYCGWFIRLHSTWQWYVRVMTFKNTWTERDCTIKQLGKELLVLLLIWQRKPNAVV